MKLNANFATEKSTHSDSTYTYNDQMLADAVSLSSWFCLLPLVHQNVAVVHMAVVLLRRAKCCPNHSFWDRLNSFIIKEKPIVMALDQSNIVTCMKWTQRLDLRCPIK